MDKAPAYGAGDSRFDPWQIRYCDLNKLVNPLYYYELKLKIIIK